MPKAKKRNSTNGNNQRQHPYRSNQTNNSNNSNNSKNTSSSATFYNSSAVEDDPRRIQQRQKQINFGKNTNGYTRYCELVPRHQRKHTDPQTPEATKKQSKRAFTGTVKAWRRQLHLYDQQDETMEEVAVATMQKEEEQQQHKHQQQQQQQQQGHNHHQQHQQQQQQPQQHQPHQQHQQRQTT